MAKRIYCSDEDIRRFLESVTNELRRTKLQSDDVKIPLRIAKDERKAKLIFSARAWIKMYALVHKFSTEVEWHGLVKRRSEGEFLVDDILIFPHEVSAATVTSDQKCYEEWLDSLDDETFNACRFHGHSHVNMGVTPSSVDMSYRKSVLDNFATPGEKDDYFYIFLITNKRGDISSEIYDLTNNALYATDEIDITVTGLKDLRERIKDAFRDSVEEYVDNLTPKAMASSINGDGKFALTLSSDVEISDDYFLSELIHEAEGLVTERKSAPVQTYSRRDSWSNTSSSLQSKSSKSSKYEGDDDEDDRYDGYLDAYWRKFTR